MSALEDLREMISMGLDKFTSNINNRAIYNRFDKCLDAEVYFIPILNEILKCNLSKCIKGQPAIDLFDDKNQIAVQVTIENNNSKVKDTLLKFAKNNLHLTYNKIYIVIIQQKSQVDIKKIDKDIKDQLPIDFILNPDFLLSINEIKKRLEELNYVQLNSISKHINDVDPFKLLANIKDVILDVKVNTLKNKFYDSVDFELLNKLFEKQIHSIPWNIKVKELIQSIYENSYLIKDKNHIDYINHLHKIDFDNINYEAILTLLKSENKNQIINTIGQNIESTIKTAEDKGNNTNRYKIKDNLVKLNSSIEYPEFNKVMFITGTAGSGKTHNILRLVSTYEIELSSEKTDNLIKPIYINNISPDRFEENIKKSFNEYFEFNSFSIIEYIVYLSTLFKSSKVVIILDNLEYLLEKDHDVIASLICNCTKLNNIYWILSINKNYLDYVNYSNNQDFIEKYSVCFNKSEKKTVTKDKFYGFEIDLILLNEWINIDYLNSTYKIQYNILKKYLTNNILTDEIDIFNYTPQIIWIFCDIATECNINSLLNLPYHKIFSKMEYHFTNKKLTANDLKRIIECISKYIIENKKEEFSFEESKSIFNPSGYNLLRENYDQNFTWNSLNDLIKNNLIVSCENKLNKKFQLSTQIYWSYKVANILSTHKYINNPDKGELTNVFLNRVFEFYILKLNNSTNNNELKLRKLIIEILNGNQISKSIIWFSANKLNSTERNIIELDIIRSLPYLSDIFYDNRHDLYSFMLFIGDREIVSSNLSFMEKLQILQVALPDISDFELSEIYFDICRDIISTINNIEDIYKSLKYFEKCYILENRRKIDELAQYIVKKIFSIIDETDRDNRNEYFIEVSNLLFKYVFDSSYIRERKRDSSGNWYRYYFWEFFLNNLCSKFVEVLDKGSYYFFKNNNWYNKDRKISRFIETEVNIAIGSMFFHKKGKDDLLDLIKYIWQKGSLQDQKNCFYIISHTVTNNSKTFIYVDDCFNNFLLSISKNRKIRLDDKYKGWLHRQLYRSNL